MTGRAQADRDFEEFVRVQWPSLVRLARVLGADHGVAEDLAQTALTKTYARWSTVRDNPASYVRKVLVTTNTDRFRGKARRDNEARYDAEPVETPEPNGAPDHGTTYGEREAQLAALRDLPPRMRAIVVLRYYEDWSDEQIADALGCTRATVRSSAARALTKLRPALSGPEPAEASSPTPVCATRPGGN